MSIGATTSKNSLTSFNLDRSILLSTIMLMGLGLVAVYSASFVLAGENFGDSLFFFKRQFSFVALSLLVMILGSYVPYQWYQKFFWPFFANLIFLLLMVFLPGLGHRAGGASRWIFLPGNIHLEPSELAKLMAPICYAFLLTRTRREGEKWYHTLLIHLGVVVLPMAIMLKQPDFGSTVIYFMVGVTILFCFGLNWLYLILVGLLSFPAFYFLVYRVPYRWKRVESFLNPWNDPAQSGFQVIQSLLGFYNGGFWGAGLGKGQSKLYFLPEAHTDFILSVIGEELGFVGLLVIFGLIIWLVVRGLQISIETKDPFGKRVAVGLAALIGFQAAINGGVVLGLLPTKGLTMPFLSYGGSSLVAMGLACGVLLNIHRQNLKFSNGNRK